MATIHKFLSLQTDGAGGTLIVRGESVDENDEHVDLGGDAQIFVAVLLAAVMLALRHGSAARVAAVVAWIEITAFMFFHGIPVEIGPSKPYWGDGTGDTLQWVGFVAILAVSAAIVMAARRAPTALPMPVPASVAA